MMDAYVICIKNNEKSMSAAERCMQSGNKYGFPIKEYHAYTPEDNPIKILNEEKGVSTVALDEEYSRTENCAAAFLSHFSLWEKTLEINRPIAVFEHDAVLVGPLDERLTNGFGYKQMISIGRPSYGNFRTPQFIGCGPLTSKNYFPGAHAYLIKPAAARTLIAMARKGGAFPTDVFLDKRRFPFLEEWFPWVAEAKDSFTTIQVERGCLAKHNYNETYEITPV